jgi:hypothetical protein
MGARQKADFRRSVMLWLYSVIDLIGMEIKRDSGELASGHVRWWQIRSIFLSLHSFAPLWATRHQGKSTFLDRLIRGP